MTRWLLILSLFATPLIAGADEDYRALLGDFNAKRYVGALAKAETFLRDHPDHKHAGAAHYIGGNAALNSGEYARAETFYRALLKDFPANRHIPKARDELVVVLDNARKLDDCIAQCNENLEAEPDSSRADHWQYMIGRAHFRMWRFRQAEEALARFQEEHPDSNYFNWARFYLDRINPELEVNESGVIAGYDGKFVKDVRFQTAVANLPKYVAEARRVLKATLGVDFQGAQAVFEFKDKNWSRTTTRATTETISVGYQPYTKMTFYTEHIVVSEADFRSRVIHELKHAAFRDLMGVGYLDLPGWVKEGLAVYGARQFDDRLPAIVGSAVFSGRDPRELLDGVDDNDRDVNDYLEDCAAFMWLEEQEPGGVHEYCARLLKGGDALELFADISGLEIREALDAAGRYAAELVNRRMGEAEQAFLDIRDAEFAARKRNGHVGWYRHEGIAGYDAWLKNNPDHPLAANARYRLGKALILVGRHEEGRARMAEILELDQLRSSICDDAQYWIALSFQREGKHEQAEDAFGVLLRDYSWSRQANNLKDSKLPAGPVTRPKTEDN